MAIRRRGIKNVYDTNDPKTLLQLKRLEADALLDLLRTINQDNIQLGKLFIVARNLLRVQLGVRKMAFFYKEANDWREAILQGIDVSFAEFEEEVRNVKRITEVNQENFPKLFEKSVEYIVPIKNKGKVDGIFLVADFADSEVEAQNDLIFIETLGNILFVAIRNKQLFREKMERELVSHELSVAERIQQQLLISDFSKFKEIDVHGINVPHHRVGGDFYDVIKKGKGSTFVAIGDVAGKGIGAALLMANLQANLRGLCAQFDDPLDIVRELNQNMAHLEMIEKFVTFFIAKVDSLNREITYVNAGHNYPLFGHKSTYVQLDKGCPPLGVISQIKIEKETLSFKKNDMLFMYTDGLVEQQNADDEMFGEDRLYGLLESFDQESSHQVNTVVYQQLRSFTGTSAVADDITLLNVKFY